MTMLAAIFGVFVFYGRMTCHWYQTSTDHLGDVYFAMRASIVGATLLIYLCLAIVNLSRVLTGFA